MQGRVREPREQAVEYQDADLGIARSFDPASSDCKFVPPGRRDPPGSSLFWSILGRSQNFTSLVSSRVAIRWIPFSVGIKMKMRTWGISSFPHLFC